jgi:signal transduction histidine kinase
MKKILAIDDQKDNLLSIKALVGYYLPHCKLFLAESGEEGIKIAAEELPDTILLDIIMPVMDGYEVCRILKQDEQTKNIPILMLSALGQDPEIRVKGLELGADAFLAKPFSPTELKSQINVMLRIKEVEDKLRKEKEVLEDIVKERTKELQTINRKQKEDIIKLTKTEEELKIALEKATESDRLKTAFLQNISHEIRTPMNGIFGFSDLLRNNLISEKEHESYINAILKSGDRMLNTLGDLMDISKLETGHVELNISTSNVNEELENLFILFKTEVEKKGLHFSYSTKLLSKDAFIETDSGKLHSIMANLISNSIKYCHNGSIEFGYTIKEDCIEFYVSDTGIGIPAERHSAIFDRFVKSDIEDKDVYEGTGLGLSISKAYVEMLGGNISVDSVVGQGSKFYFTHPHNRSPRLNVDSKAESPVIQFNKQIDGLKILVAEDDFIATEYLSIIMHDISSAILRASNGHEAVKICRNNSDIDMIFMDLKMPIVDGYEATKQIREFNKEVIIIAQIAYALAGDREKALNAGCNDYISKPINKSALIEIINKLVG